MAQQQPSPTQTVVQGIPLAPLPLYPVMASLQDVVDLADSRLPVTSRNDIVALLMTYHNTMLSQLGAAH